MNLPILGQLHFNWLDIFITVLFVILVIRGLFTGFSRSASTLFGVLAGFWIAANQYAFVSRQMSAFIENPLWRDLGAFFLLFLVVYLCFLIAGILLHGLFKALKLRWFDVMLGGFFGFLKAMAFSGMVVFILTLTLPTESPFLKGSRLYPVVSDVARWMTAMAPENLKGKFMWKWRRMQKELKGLKQEKI